MVTPLAFQPLSFSRQTPTGEAPPPPPRQRSGYQSSNPYESANYPFTGAYVQAPNPYDGLGWRTFGVGLLRPFAQLINGGIRAVNYATSSVNHAFLTLLGVGATAIIGRAFSEKQAVKPALALAALGAAGFYGFKSVVKVADGRNTLVADGDFPYVGGTALSYGVIAAALLAGARGGNIFHPRTLTGAITKVGDGIAHIIPTTGRVFKGIGDLFRGRP
jgi:hypothetical protein